MTEAVAVESVVNPWTFYIAGSFQAMDEVEQYAAFFESLGGMWRFNWIPHVRAYMEDSPDRASFSELAVVNLEAAETAQFFLFVYNPDVISAGAHVELGARLASGQCVLFVGPCEVWEESIFYCHPNVVRFQSMDHFQMVFSPIRVPQDVEDISAVSGFSRTDYGPIIHHETSKEKVLHEARERFGEDFYIGYWDETKSTWWMGPVNWGRWVAVSSKRQSSSG